MSIALQAASLFLFLVLLRLFHPWFYVKGLMQDSRRILNRYGLKLEELHYSFEDITYLVHVPTQNPALLEARLEDLYCRKEFVSFLYPRIKGVRIYAKTRQEGDIPVAYLPIDRYTLPVLRLLQMKGYLDEETYRRISGCKLVHPGTLKEIMSEVYRQLRTTDRFL